MEKILKEFLKTVVGFLGNPQDFVTRQGKSEDWQMEICVFCVCEFVINESWVFKLKHGKLLCIKC